MNIDPAVSFEKRRREFEEYLLQFLSAELELAETFVEVAKTTGDDERALRNRLNARKAYNTASFFWGKTPLPLEESNQIQQRLSALKSELESLGERFD